MSRRKPRTLLWRFGAALMLIQALAAVSIGWYAYNRISNFQQGQTLDRLSELSTIFAARYAEHLDHDSSAFNRLVREDGARLNDHVRITIIAQDGLVLADSIAAADTMDDHSTRPEIRQAIQHGVGSEVRFSNTLGANLMYHAIRVDRSGRPPIIVRTSMPTNQATADLNRVVRTVGFVGGGLVLLTLLIIYFVSRRVSRQIAHMAAGAAQFAAGDLSHRIEPSPVREFLQLSDSLNRMAAELQARITQLQTQRNEQQAILQSMSNGVVAIDSDQRIVDMNRAAERLLNVDAEASRGRLIQEVCREPELHHFVARALEDPSHQSDELVFEADTTRNVQAVSTTIRDTDARPTGLLVVLNDVTQLRRLESMRSDFAANVSHELRTPITSIKGYVETLLEVGIDDPQQVTQFLKIIRANSNRLAAIVEDVMSLTRLEEPGFREALEREMVPISAVAEAVVGQFKPAAEQKRVRLRLDIDAQFRAPMHAQMIEQALANLVSNAIGYSPEDSTVTIAARRTPGDRIEITVSDEGVGIAPEHLDRLFERFYRADKARSRQLGGTGLGLAIVKHIAQVHGGEVGVTSELGRGSTFRITLPAR